MFTRVLVILALAVLPAGVAQADFRSDFRAGMEAFKAGNYAEAAELFTPLAAEGHLPSLNNLALLYSRGLGVARDEERAIEFYGRAAEAGYPIAQFNLAMICVKRGDQVEATTYLRDAAQRGHLRSQVQLGVRFAEGIGAEQNVVRGVAWLAVAGKSAKSELALRIDVLAANLRSNLSAAEVATSELLAEVLGETLPQVSTGGDRF